MEYLGVAPHITLVIELIAEVNIGTTSKLFRARVRPTEVAVLIANKLSDSIRNKEISLTTRQELQDELSKLSIAFNTSEDAVEKLISFDLVLFRIYSSYDTEFYSFLHRVPRELLDVYRNNMEEMVNMMVFRGWCDLGEAIFKNRLSNLDAKEIYHGTKENV